MQQPSQFYWYLAGVASFIVPHSVQMVLIPWMVVILLEEGPARLGLVQMAGQLPGLLLVLFGGLLADRIDNRRILVGCHLVAAVPAGLMAVAAYLGLLQLPLVFLYVLALGSVAAFVQPARDAVLNRIAGEDLQKIITITMGLTFGAQIIGYLIASTLDSVGPVVLLTTQSLLLGGGAFLALGLHAARPEPNPARASALSDIYSGLKQVLGSGRMRAALLPLLGVGIFFGGMFIVLNPVIVKEVYGGDAQAIAWSYIAFMIGTVASTVMLVLKGGVLAQGRALLAAIFVGGGLLALTTLVLPFAFYLLTILAWGMCGGVAMSMSRTIVQESAPVAFRARAMSIFSLANLGGMPIGALSMGYLAAAFGPLTTILFAVGGVWFVAALAWWVTPIWSVQRLTMVEREALGAG